MRVVMMLIVLLIALNKCTFSILWQLPFAMWCTWPGLWQLACSIFCDYAKQLSSVKHWALYPNVPI